MPFVDNRVLRNWWIIRREVLIRILILFSIILLFVDFIYKYWNGITPQTKQLCVLYNSMPQWLFLFYEYFVELFLLVVVGVFAAALLKKYLVRIKMYIPRNPLIAFIYASILPLCSCSVIPFVSLANNRIPLRSIITFIVAAPLLNPYIVVLSFTVLGLYYTILRVLASMVLAISTGYITEFFFYRFKFSDSGFQGGCNSGNGCGRESSDVFNSAFIIIKKIIPFLIAAGIFGVIAELLFPSRILNHLDFKNNLFTLGIVILIGIPMYLCNGADVLFLQPLVQYVGLPMGTAIAFSLTSTAICMSSIVLLIKFIGNKLTAVIVTCLICITFLLSTIINIISS